MSVLAGLVCVACEATNGCTEDCNLKDVMSKIRDDFEWLKAEGDIGVMEVTS